MMKALSLYQPWAWLMANGYKDIENRSWPTKYRGPVLIHASKTWDRGNFPLDEEIFYTDLKMPFPKDMHAGVNSGHYRRGGIVGIMTITECVSKSSSPWFFGPFGFVVKDARPLPFVPLRGAMGFFDVPDEIVKQLGLEGVK